jgi:hypothetical protein
MMRVIQVLRILSIALLIIPLIGAVAGAMYVEGQAPPDDGQMHILAAEDGSGTDAVPVAETIDDNSISPISAMEPLGATFPATPTTAFPADAVIPSVSIKNSSGLSTEVVVGHVEPPMISGYWDNVDIGTLRTNMPVLTLLGWDASEWI